MHPTLLFFLPFFGACNDKEATDTASEPQSDTGNSPQSDSGNDPQDTAEPDTAQPDTAQTDPPQWTNICLNMPDADHEILFSGNAYHDGMIMNPELVITTQEEWDVFTTELIFQSQNEALTRDDFDWGSEHVAVLSVYVSSTCGLAVLDADSCTLGAQSHLFMAVDDTSGNCENICEAEGQALLIVAMPITDTFFTSELVPTCDE